MQSIAPFNQVQPTPSYVPPAERVASAPQMSTFLQPFKLGINDSAVFPFLAGLVLGSALR